MTCHCPHLSSSAMEFMGSGECVLEAFVSRNCRLSLFVKIAKFSFIPAVVV